jgi:hypothetical protein
MAETGAGAAQAAPPLSPPPPPPPLERRASIISAPARCAAPRASLRAAVAIALLLLLFFEAEVLGLARAAGLPDVAAPRAAAVAPAGAAARGGGGGGGGAASAGAAARAHASLLYDFEPRAAAVARLEALGADEARDYAPLTAAAQRLLYEWQHPATCAGRTFYVSAGNEPLAGLGSHVHIATAHLALAMEHGAVFLWSHDVGAPYVDAATCAAAGGAQSLECFFERPSNCTLEDAAAPGATSVPLLHGDVGLKLPGGLQFYHVPRAMQELWERAGLPVVRGETTGQQDAVKYWFRAQAAAFLARFNAPALRFMRALRGNATLMRTAAGAGAPRDYADRGPGVPLARGTISLHIRHGDKHKEMALVPTEAYLAEALHLTRLHPLALGGARIFVSTEDPGSIEALVAAVTGAGDGARAAAFSVAWWDVPRDNSNGPEQLAKLGLPRGELTLVWWLQLLIALEADAWVGTRGSNWNRLIDELRCVWLPKCQNVFAEVGDEKRWERASRSARRAGPGRQRAPRAAPRRAAPRRALTPPPPPPRT